MTPTDLVERAAAVGACSSEAMEDSAQVSRSSYDDPWCAGYAAAILDIRRAINRLPTARPVVVDYHAADIEYRRQTFTTIRHDNPTDRARAIVDAALREMWDRDGSGGSIRAESAQYADQRLIGATAPPQPTKPQASAGGTCPHGTNIRRGCVDCGTAKPPPVERSGGLWRKVEEALLEFSRAQYSDGEYSRIESGPRVVEARAALIAAIHDYAKPAHATGVVVCRGKLLQPDDELVPVVDTSFGKRTIGNAFAQMDLTQFHGTEVEVLVRPVTLEKVEP